MNVAWPDFEVANADALTFEADVLVVFLHVSFGFGGGVANLLEGKGRVDAARVAQIRHLVSKDGVELVDSGGAITPRKVLFIGAPSITTQRYSRIRQAMEAALTALSRLTPRCPHLAITIPGAGIGLDEGEVFNAALSGVHHAILDGPRSKWFGRITVVEKDSRRASRFKAMLPELLQGYQAALPSLKRSESVKEAPQERPAAPRVDPVSKPHAFVAMPFHDELGDLYHFGIQDPVNQSGLLCERADHSHFTGDILTYIKDRIATAAVVIAEVSAPNANVYLEVGFAWGRNRPTILLTKDTKELKFDIRGHRCLVYDNIRGLREMLGNYLQAARESRDGW